MHIYVYIQVYMLHNKMSHSLLRLTQLLVKANTVLHEVVVGVSRHHT